MQLLKSYTCTNCFQSVLLKVAAIFGVFGACRRHELHKLGFNDVKEEGSVLVVRLLETKTHKTRMFTIIQEAGGTSYVDICKKYIALRPKHTVNGKLFLYYRNGRCTTQPVGINTLGKIPKDIATYLKLTDPHLYTGHCFRRTSATILVDNGADLMSLKRHGGWQSSSVAETYIEDSVQSKISIARKIVSKVSVVEEKSVAVPGVAGISFSEMQNCTFNITIQK